MTVKNLQEWLVQGLHLELHEIGRNRDRSLLDEIQQGLLRLAIGNPASPTLMKCLSSSITKQT